jgi:hypothetical protein
MSALVMRDCSQAEGGKHFDLSPCFKGKIEPWRQAA